jgi:hypothetical protein
MTTLDIEKLNAFMEQWQQVSRQIKARSICLEDSQAFAELVQSVGEAQEVIRESMEPVFAMRRGWKAVLESTEVRRGVLGIQESVQKFLTYVAPALERLREIYQELPPKVQDAILLLGEHGWYFDLNMPLSGLWRLQKALSEGDIQDAEEALVKYFESRIDEIESSVLEKFPERKELIEAAFNAHRSGDYILSIPVFLAQVDGVCKDVVGKYFFMKKDRKPSTAQYVEQIATNSFQAAICSPLANVLPINMSEYDRGEGFKELNRHMVLHGESLDYGTSLNSLKAISLINYIAQVLPNDDGDEDF